MGVTMQFMPPEGAGSGTCRIQTAGDAVATAVEMAVKYREVTAIEATSLLAMTDPTEAAERLAGMIRPGFYGSVALEIVRFWFGPGRQWRTAALLRAARPWTDRDLAATFD